MKAHTTPNPSCVEPPRLAPYKIYLYSWLPSITSLVIVTTDVRRAAAEGVRAEGRQAWRDSSLNPGSGRAPGGGHGDPLQYPCLENPMDKEAWRATVHGVAKGRTQLKWEHTHARSWHFYNSGSKGKRSRGGQLNDPSLFWSLHAPELTECWNNPSKISTFFLEVDW